MENFFAERMEIILHKINNVMKLDRQNTTKTSNSELIVNTLYVYVCNRL